MHPWTLYALEVSKDRQRDYRNERLLIEARAADPKPSRLRRPMAVALAAVSRGSAAAARRLDDSVADHLSRSLAATK